MCNIQYFNAGGKHGPELRSCWHWRPHSARHAHAQQEKILPAVEVIGSTPLPGIGQPRNEIAAPVQTARSRDIERSGALELGDFMNRTLGSVHVNEMQGNPFQMDVSYRGYTASPLLGTPQGLSVYMDGVRINQPFGDVVSWDLIPRAAISSMTLMPGSNPLFGLNTLGGALSVQTKNGRSDPGTSLQTTVGSNARRASSSNMAASTTRDWTGMSAATCSGRTAGAMIRRPMCASCSASWAGAAAPQT